MRSRQLTAFGGMQIHALPVLASDRSVKYTSSHNASELVLTLFRPAILESTAKIEFIKLRERK
jgi:hypothetical protein